MIPEEYFEYRNISASDYEAYRVPVYLLHTIKDKNSKILDFGCGYGQLIKGLNQVGYSNVDGADINESAIKHLRDNKINVFDLSKSDGLFSIRAAEYDYIIASHVIEHIKKEEIVSKLSELKRLLRPDGSLIVMVPNAQSNTGCYWAYEDFTHHTLFTSGSLYYVLRSAGYSSVEFLDVDCTVGQPASKAVIKKTLLWLYRVNRTFWNQVTNSSYHKPSPEIYSYEIKALAKP